MPDLRGDLSADFEVHPEEDQRHQDEGRLLLLTAIDAALRRHAEVFPLIVGSTSRADAQAAVAALLTTSEMGAEAVLNLQWGDLILDRRAELGSELSAHQRAMERPKDS